MTSPAICPDCGAWVSGGREGCQAVYDGLSMRALDDFRYSVSRDLAFDTYCMQHVEKYCLSAKSYVAHLTRLCCGMEYGGDLAVYAAIQRFLNRQPALVKPPILEYLGELTVVQAASVESPAAYQQQVRRWAECVWQAYQPQQALARAWIKQALNPAGRS